VRRVALCALLLATPAIATPAIATPAIATPAIATPAIAQEAWVPKGTAELILLDKIRAQPNPVAVKVGDATNFGSLTIRVRGCVVRPPDQAADAAAFVEVSDTRGKTDVFRGWILASAPGVSQMEHPVYDLKLAGCR